MITVPTLPAKYSLIVLQLKRTKALLRNPVLGPCEYDDNWICQVEMARDAKSLNDRLACFLTANSDAPDLPTLEQINQYLGKIDGYAEGMLVKNHLVYQRI